MIVLDTGVLLAYFVATDPDHDSARALFDTESVLFFTTPLVLAELDYFVLERFGPLVESRVVEHLLDSPISLTPFGLPEMASCARLLARYQDLELGLTDASVMVAAESLGTNLIATFDERDFRAVRMESGAAFELLPQG